MPLGSLVGLSVTEVGESFERGAKKIYLPSDEDCATLSKLLDIAISFARDRFASVERFRELRSMPKSWKPEPGPVYCFTGPAGSGRSSLLQQLPKLMPTPGDVRIAVEAAGSAELLHLNELSQILIQARMRSEPFDLLVEQYSKGVFGKLRGADADRYLRKAMLNGGSSILTIDELQFFTQGAEATTLIVQLLYRSSNLGVPVLYSANYSLGAKLFRRNKEDRDRILPRPIILGEGKPDVAYIERFLGGVYSFCWRRDRSCLI